MRDTRTHPDTVAEWYARLLSGTTVDARTVELPERGRVHVLERGSGPPLLLLHGSGLAAGFFLPLLDALRDVHAIAPDLPGCGLSDPVPFSRHTHAEAAVAWLDSLLDRLGLDTVSLAGHSGGGVWALRYALARPDRVHRLVLLGVPSLPGTRCPTPQRIMATPGLGWLFSRVPASRESVLRFAEVMGERAALEALPDLVDMFLVARRDPLAAAAFRNELRVLVSPLGLVTRSGWSRRGVRADELQRVAVPTLVIWGDREPLGSVEVARGAARLVPQCEVQVLPGGHGPWLGQPDLTASAVAGFLRE